MRSTVKLIITLDNGTRRTQIHRTRVCGAAD
jgi:hypothetical protein